MAFTQNSKIRTTARVRVTKRVESKPDHRGRRQLLAREGEEMSAREALRRGIPERHLEGVGPGAKLVKTAVKKAAGSKDSDAAAAALAEAEEQARKAAREEQQKAAGQRADGLRSTPSAPDVTYPNHRGGGNWELSDGSTFQGKKADAEKAEAALQENAGNGDGGDKGNGGS